MQQKYLKIRREQYFELNDENCNVSIRIDKFDYVERKTPTAYLKLPPAYLSAHLPKYLSKLNLL